MKNANFKKRKKALKNSYASFNRIFRPQLSAIEMVIVMMTATSDDFIPGDNEGFDDWQENFVSVITANLATFAILITDPDYVDLLAEQGRWNTDWAAGKPSASGRTKSLTRAMQDRRKSYEKLCRDFNQEHLAHNKKVTPTYKVALRITVPDTTQTDVPLPDESPIGTIGEIGHLHHKIQIQNPDTPDTKGIPTGIKVLVYRLLNDGAAPAPTDKFDLLRSITTHTYTSHFEEEHEGKKAHYYLRWENPKGERSDPSEVFSARVA